ncbi:RagB/SusD family nutrient uptake outer membrane protein [Riemerella columbina]|uniref:RagB/SusD family nutrient uptake outer membrane protein n=1 Tax=Riemerella columbina TaxID=103810 RepID=UPI0026703772|nr:RagB/SusD family nutrient uptake outer membrane protein [Riemerella columbina]WKS94565.1 RagB/SusD family nutrient uptake outer membrane protein [Riemerella columbina]
MNSKYLKIGIAALALQMGLTSCERDLSEVHSSNTSSVVIYQDFSNYKGILAKCYAGLALSGQEGGDGNADIGGGDGGTFNYLRQYFQLQELPTDEAIIAWGDANLPDLHNMTWGADNPFTMAMYYRILYQVGIANEFIRETTDEKLASRNITGAQAEEAREYRSEARFLRALSYYHAIDMFGNVPFLDENSPVGITPPPRIERKDLFTFLEKELKDLENQLKAPRTNEYGRADRAAVWMLLAKLYLNAEVYTGQAHYTEAADYAKKVIDAGYSLKPKYEELFLADNNLDNNEVIFSINFDGLHSQTWGGTTYIIHAAIGGSMPAADFGVNGGWGGLRTTKNLVQKFPDAHGNQDIRGRFFTNGQSYEIDNISNFTDGYPLIKFKNVTRAGVAGKDPSLNFVDTDFPLFRLADAYLMYAEAVLRGGNGNLTEALGYVNKLRERAYGNTSGNIQASALTLNFILDERARELAWEGSRRTDLIRFGQFTSDNYVWPWKGGVKDGKAVENFRTLYPIPSKDLIANPNLIQNPGY